MDEVYAAAGEYPKIEGRCEMSDALCLMGDYGGRNGETTAIIQYIYQHYITAGVDERLSRMMRGIALVEMRHHALLADAIVRSGGTPYVGTVREFWTARSVSYSKDIPLFLMNDIAAETAAVAAYRKTLLCLTNESIKRLVSRIIEDEEVHLSLLGDYLAEIGNSRAR